MEEKLNWIDADTILVAACMAAQYNCMAYHINGQPHGPTKSKLQWTKDFPKLNPDHFEFRKEATLKENGREPAMNLCKNIVVAAVRKIEAKYPDYTAWVCIEGKGNYRKELYPNYKGTRSGEIILRKELSRWVVDHFPRVKLSFGCETDDTVAMWQWCGHLDFLKTGTYTHMVSSCDKDAKTVAGKLYNFGKDIEYLITELEADRWFCTQMLSGDSIDNIKGINGPISKDLSKELGVRANSLGVGDITAKNIMATAATSKECFELLLRCYRDVHGDSWLVAMQLEAIALRMQHVEGERYKILDHMLHLGVDTNE